MLLSCSRLPSRGDTFIILSRARGWWVVQRAGQHPYDAAVDPGVSETERVCSWSVSARGSMGLGPIGAAGSVPRVLES